MTYPNSQSYPYHFRGQDVFQLADLLDNLVFHRIIHKQERQGLPAQMFASQMHTRNVHVALAENGSDFPDHAGRVVIREEDHVAARHHFKGKAVDIDNAR